MRLASGLSKNAHKIYLLTSQMPDDDDDLKYFESINIWWDPDSLRQCASMLEDKIDIVHVVNEPDWMVIQLKESLNKPVIHDATVIDSMRQAAVNPDEIKAYQIADAAIFQSIGERDWVTKLHNYGGTALVLPNLYTLDMIPRTQQYPKIRGLCYRGQIVADDNRPWMRALYDLRHIVGSFCAQGHNIAIYGSSNAGPEVHDIYASMGALVYGATTTAKSAIPHLARFDWGLVACGGDHVITATTVPAALFDYIAAGIPIVALKRCSAAAEIVEKQGIGIVIDDAGDLKEKYEWVNNFQAQVIRNRERLAIEKNLSALTDFYATVLSTCLSRQTDQKKEMRADVKDVRNTGQ